MIPTSTATSTRITWSRIRHSRNYQISMGTEVLGSLKRPSFWSCEFIAETQGGRWLLRRTGFFRNNAEVVDAETGRQIATFQSDWGGGGTLAFYDGQSFRLASSGWLRPVWTFSSEQGQPVLSMHRRERTFQLPGSFAVSDSRLALLMTFILYRVQQAEEEAATGALIAAT